MRGDSAGSVLRMRSEPLDEGRHWQTETVKPEKSCSGVPGLSTESGMTLNCTSARPSLAFEVQAKPPTWPAPTVRGPRECASHCQPMRASPMGLRT